LRPREQIYQGNSAGFLARMESFYIGMELVKAHALFLWRLRLKGHIFHKNFAGTIVSLVSFYIGTGLVKVHALFL